jgi:transposase
MKLPGRCCGRPAAPAPRPPGLGRRRLLRQGRHLGRNPEDDAPDRRQRDPHAFEILPRRWVVERTFAWISKHRRTVRDYEHLPPETPARFR